MRSVKPIEWRKLSIAILALISISVCVTAQSTPDEAERAKAFDLYRNGKVSEALPLFEKLTAANPWDREAVEALGYLVLGSAVYAADPAARKAARIRGRELLLRAQQLGADSPLLKSTLAGLPADGGDDVSFSAQKEVNDAMREGEEAFANRNYEKAIALYGHALLFDPKQYEAAVFTGDAYFQLGNPTLAGDWYAKAIAIDPNRETAYRYWGDVLMKSGKMLEARDKFLEAYIREPYSRLTQSSFVDWGSRNNVELAHPEIQIPTSVTPENGNVTINLDPGLLKNDKDPGLAAWLMYGVVRASWAKSDFAKEYPEEKTYRHSLKEEAAALRAVAQSIIANKKVDKLKLDPSLQILVKLETDGLIESYILLARPDQGIVEDFVTYRNANIDKLRRYVMSYILK